MNTILIFIFSVILFNNGPVYEAREEFKLKVRKDITCSISIDDSIGEQFKTDIIGKSILIRADYWGKLDHIARKVVIIRELLHCELGIPYMVGMSIMNKKITIARTIYIYGAY